MRQLRTELPLLTRFYGLKPWDVERMPIREVSNYLLALRKFEARGGDPWLGMASGG